MPKRIRVDRIIVSEPVPAGMSPLVVMSLAYMYRSTTEDADPITVTREGPHYRVADGRHRYLASVIAGRRRILATIEE